METEESGTIEITQGNKEVLATQQNTEGEVNPIDAFSDIEGYKSQLRQLEIKLKSKELNRKEEELKQLTQDREQRKTFAKWVLIVVSGWVVWVIITTIVHAYKNGLTEREMCVLLGATAVVSLATTVLKGLFNSR